MSDKSETGESGNSENDIAKLTFLISELLSKSALKPSLHFSKTQRNTT